MILKFPAGTDRKTAMLSLLKGNVLPDTSRLAAFNRCVPDLVHESSLTEGAGFFVGGVLIQ